MKYYGTIGTSQQTVVKDTIQYSPSENEILMNEARPSAEHIAKEDGTWYIPQPDLSTVKTEKLLELKEIRDTREQSPLDYEDNSYDYDLKSVAKLNEARDKLIKKGGDQVWITATNTIVYLTLDDIDGIKLAGADRSNSLHIKYAQLREYVNSLESVEDVNAVTFDMSLPETELLKE